MQAFHTQTCNCLLLKKKAATFFEVRSNIRTTNNLLPPRPQLQQTDTTQILSFPIHQTSTLTARKEPTFRHHHHQQVPTTKKYEEQIMKVEPRNDLESYSQESPFLLHVNYNATPAYYNGYIATGASSGSSAAVHIGGNEMYHASYLAAQHPHSSPSMYNSMYTTYGHNEQQEEYFQHPLTTTPALSTQIHPHPRSHHIHQESASFMDPHASVFSVYNDGLTDACYISSNIQVASAFVEPVTYAITHSPQEIVATDDNSSFVPPSYYRSPPYASSTSPTQAQHSYIDQQRTPDHQIIFSGSPAPIHVNNSQALIPCIDSGQAIPVNSKQAFRILKRREARTRFERQYKSAKERRMYLHKSRHEHACGRVRDSSGRFLAKKNALEDQKSNQLTQEAQLERRQTPLTTQQLPAEIIRFVAQSDIQPLELQQKPKQQQQQPSTISSSTTTIISTASTLTTNNPQRTPAS